MKDIRLKDYQVEIIKGLLKEIVEAGPEAEKLAKEKCDGSMAYAFGFVEARTRDNAKVIMNLLNEKGGLK